MPLKTVEAARYPKQKQRAKTQHVSKTATELEGALAQTCGAQQRQYETVYSCIKKPIFTLATEELAETPASAIRAWGGLFGRAWRLRDGHSPGIKL